MKLACQSSLAGNGSLVEQCRRIRDWGFEGVELTAWESVNDDRAKFALSLEEEALAAMGQSGMPITSICGGLHFDFMHPDAAKRRADVDRLKALLQMAGRLGANGVIMVPVFHGSPQLPDLWPIKSAVELQKEMLLAELAELAPVAQNAGTCVILEPLNRYEAPWLNRLEQAADICQQLNSPGVGFMADVFHMNIEEVNPAEAIGRHGQWLRHVHLADNTRLEPGTGITDFSASFRALKEIGFVGAMALECGLSAQPGMALPKSVEFLRTCLGLRFAD